MISDEILYLANSIDRESYDKTLYLYSQKKNVIPLFGIHPAQCEFDSTPYSLMEKIFSRSALIGETGMDFHWVEDRSRDNIQRIRFKEQMRLASRYKCIPSIHTKGAEKEILEILKDYGIYRSIIHWYSGPLELIPDYLETGAFFTIGPDIFEDSEIWQHIPVERIFAETDNPTGMPSVLGGNADLFQISKVYEKLAEKLELTTEELIIQLKDNFQKLMN